MSRWYRLRLDEEGGDLGKTEELRALSSYA